ncbi:E3 ubiquitin-protein ligase TRIM45-like isoform X1 [Diabrotica undecimpunctata]|uniref:E3 ubiquitin-protein ligase TRIM45-like isoform X1 n=1 Tax=Diabrotica undecimpunctata TaxID=50387 RepID=UPI003B63DA7E
MMDIDKFSYIFGSFARRRQSQEATAAKRRSIEPTRIKLTSSHSKKQMITFSKTRGGSGISAEEAKNRCPMCKKQFEDPRVLPCLHTFCLKCLEQLEKTDVAVWCDDDSEAQKTDETGSRKASSAGSGYVSDRPGDFSPGKGFYCPSCGAGIDIPKAGVSCFLPNYTLIHKATLANLNLGITDNLCNICASDKSALFRCMVCKLNMCDICEEVHHRQKSSANHEILLLENAKQKEISIMKRPIMCTRHQENEMTIFCTSCYQVICRDCVNDYHLDHICEPVSRAVKTHFTKLRLLSDKAKNVVEESAVAASKLNAASKNIEAKVTEVQEDVEKFIDEYIQSVEKHKVGLLEQIRQVREEKLQNIAKEKNTLQKKLRDARDVSYFLSDLLTEGSDAEILSFVHLVINKVEKCGNFEPTTELKLSGSLQFLKEETVKCPDNIFTMYGVLTTQSVSPENCVLNTAVLQNLRVGKKVEVLLETRDNDDLPIERGGEGVTAEIRHREAGISKSIVVNVKDKRNGTYIISFVPDVPGKLVLNVCINKQPVKGSPFPVNVRTIKQHVGIYHCCSFCSSRGNKESTCGCPGTMPGGYKGCGHGHEGHPGRRHWSCCGNILEHSECTRTKQQNCERNFTTN